jgi:histidinol-phosphate aminotransferase
LTGPYTPPTAYPPHATLEGVSQPAEAPPRATDGLAFIKPSVRQQAGYELAAPPARRKLNQNESPFDFPLELKREIVETITSRPWQRYPEFSPAELRASLASYYGWIPEGILTGNGSNELIQATLAVTLGADDVLVAPSPTFSLYRLLTGVNGGRYVPVPLGDTFAFDVDRLIDTARRERARVIVLNSPNNPTGSALPDGGVERILAETDAFVVCDEAYQEFGGPTALPLLRQTSRVLVLRTFSKAFGLAGLRFGVALAHPAVAQEIAKGKLPYNVNLVTLTAARTALHHAPMLAARTQQVIETRDRFVARLGVFPGLTVYPSAANFVLFRCRSLSAPDLFRRLLDEYGILVRDLSGSSELADCLRVSIGTDEDMDAVLAAIQEILWHE